MANHEGTVTSVPLRLHHVLLTLAGRIDDGALGHARQLSAAARADEAAELVAGTLIAGRIPLRPSERQAFGEVLAASGGDVSLLDQLTVSEHDVDVERTHHFSGEDQPDAGVATALEPIKTALADLRSVRAVWRNTAAGRVPGAVPQRVVLVELGAQGSPPATADRVAAALRNAGIPAVAEVASPDVEWTTYHQQALAAAVPVIAEAGGDAAPVRELPRRQQAEPADRQAAEAPDTAGFFAVPEQPAFAARPPAEVSNGTEPAPRQATAASSVSQEPRKTNGHHRADRQPAEEREPVAERPQPEPVAEQQPTEQPQPVAEEQPAEPPNVGGSRVLNFPESAVESTAELSDADAKRLHDALREAEAAERGGAQSQQPEAAQLSASGAEAQLSERDRELLRELHAELAKREREQAAQVKLNGWHRPS